MKKIITAFCLFVSLLTGSAFADTLKLPGGEVLDSGDKVDVWTMEESFFNRPGNSLAGKAVSYTHLTLPTICSV